MHPLTVTWIINIKISTCISLSKILKNYFSVLSVRRDRSESTVQAEECRIFPRSDLDQKYLLSMSRSLRVCVFKHCQRYATVFSVRCSKSLQWFNLQACEVSQKHRRTHGAEGPSLITWSFTPGETTLIVIHPIMNQLKKYQAYFCCMMMTSTEISSRFRNLNKHACIF